MTLSSPHREDLARALHDVVYAPGTSYDRTVPGIQEHMRTCADRVAAALPWLAGVDTPTHDPATAQDAQILDDIYRDAYGYWLPARAEILRRFRRPTQETPHEA